jgi:hypothetical protein
MAHGIEPNLDNAKIEAEKRWARFVDASSGSGWFTMNTNLPKRPDPREQSNG